MLPVILFTGLSGSGKTTLSRGVHTVLISEGFPSELLDGDVMRQLLSPDLGFSPRDRYQSVRRINSFAQELNRNGKLVLMALIAPFRALRAEIRAEHPFFIEVFVDAPLAVCERRDPKRLYRRARKGELSDFTGITSPYEEPIAPELVCRTDFFGVGECTQVVLDGIMQAIQLQLQKTA